MFRNFLVNLLKFDKDAGSSGAGGEGGSSQADDKSKKGGEANGGSNGGGSTDDKSGGANGGGEGGELDVTKLDPKVQKLIADLRKENGDHRKKNKILSESQEKLKKTLIDTGVIDNDEEPTEEKLKNVTQTNEQLNMRSAILEAAVENNVSKDDLKYFTFLIQEAVSGLKDDEELTDAQIADIAKAAKRNGNPMTTTSVDNSKDNSTKKPGASGEVTVEQFAKMNMGEKTAIYVKDKDLYNRMMAEAKEKNLLIK